MYGQVYKITYSGDQYYYIGQTRKLLQKRLSSHFSRCRQGYRTKLYDWLRSKEDWDFIHIQSLHQCQSQQELDDLEITLIDLNDPFCLNTSEGGLRGGGNYQYGNNHHQTKIPDEDLDLIFDLYNSGKYSQRDIADIYEVSFQLISQILRGKRSALSQEEASQKRTRKRVETNPSQQHLEARERAHQIRLFAQKYKHLSGADIGRHFGADTLQKQKHIRMILRNRVSPDQSWDPITRTFK